ncbi:hypothetical protein [Streptomyces sp. NPDC002779]|uniref:hypothetical protein n=1 Tax=Streptomyces sp. NPDC002779 TaxID=3364664 RepID=UPI00368C4F10
MRDKREPTLPNARGREGGEPLAGRVPKALAARLRAARNSVGLSQGAVADAMTDRGFSWRQTTVAKSEAADRPVLFAEVVALAQIYKRPIEYFLHPGTGLDSLIDDVSHRHELQAAEIRKALAVLNELRAEQEQYTRILLLGMPIVRYRESADSGPLRDGLQAALKHWGYRVLTEMSVFETLDIAKEQLDKIDHEALREVALLELNTYERTRANTGSLPESSEMLNGLRDFLDGKEPRGALLEVLREGEEWRSLVCVGLTDLVIEAVARQRPHDY